MTKNANGETSEDHALSSAMSMLSELCVLNLSAV